MSKISLKHSGGNVVSLNSPTSAPTSADVAFKLPNQDGSANEVLKTDGSGNLSFGADSGGKFASYALICDQKGASTEGGSSTTGSFLVRDLNTEIADADNIVSISSNQFTLQAGSYLIKASCPAHLANAHMCQIYNHTDSSVVSNGSAEYVFEGGSTTRTFVVGRVTIASAKAFTIRHRVSRANSGNGFGVPNGWVTEQRYTIVEIYKEA